MVSAQFDDDLNALEGLVNSQNDQNGNSDLDVDILEDLVKLQENNNGNDNNDLNVLEDLGNVWISRKNDYNYVHWYPV